VSYMRCAACAQGRQIVAGTVMCQQCIDQEAPHGEDLDAAHEYWMRLQEEALRVGRARNPVYKGRYKIRRSL